MKHNVYADLSSIMMRFSKILICLGVTSFKIIIVILCFKTKKVRFKAEKG